MKINLSADINLEFYDGLQVAYLYCENCTWKKKIVTDTNDTGNRYISVDDEFIGYLKDHGCPTIEEPKENKDFVYLVEVTTQHGGNIFRGIDRAFDSEDKAKAVVYDEMSKPHRRSNWTYMQLELE